MRGGPEGRMRWVGDLKLKLCFALPATAEEVVLRLSRSMRGTELRLVRLEGDGDVLYPVRSRGTACEAQAWEALVGPRPGRPLAGEDVTRLLARVEEHLPPRVSVVLAGVPRPSLSRS